MDKIQAYDEEKVRICSFSCLEIWGHNDCLFKSDQEPSMSALHNALVKLRRPLKLIPENSPKGESQSNGKIERGNRTAKGQFRCILFASEERFGVQVDLGHPIVAWMVQHSGYLITHFQVDKSGRTPYERLKGKKCNIDL